MILADKKTGVLYNFIGVENDGLELMLKLERWQQVKGKLALRKVKRTFTVYSWDQLIEQMQKYEERSIGTISQQDVKRWLNADTRDELLNGRNND